MRNWNFLASDQRGDETRGALGILFSLLLVFQPLAVLSVSAQQRRPRARRDVPAQTQALTDDRRIAHVLARLSFGARPGDFERVKAMGVAAYIEQQLDPDSINDDALDARLARLPTLALATPVLIEQYNPPPKPAPTPSPTPKPAPPASPPATKPTTRDPASASTASPAAKTDAKKASITPTNKPAAPTAAGGGGAKPAAPKPTPPARNPQQVVTELQRAAFLRAVYSERQLNEIMVDFWENHFSIFINKDSDRFLLTGFDREATRPFALGRFRDLLGATAHAPAMLYYLDNWQSSVLRKYPAANGKPARTSGGINENYARELMELHTLGVDGGYTQKDVQEVARCFTGWTIHKPNEEGLFFFNPAAHDNGEKTVLGHKIPAGGGIADGERVLDILARHSSTARFIATKLARRFISDDPPVEVINRAAAVFLKTDGSIRETLRAIITSPEFFSRAAYRAKIRSPFEYAVASVRALQGETDGDRPVLDWIARMGQPVFGRLTPDGYPDRAEQWLSTGTLLERFNFASALATNRIKGTRIDFSRLFTSDEMSNPHGVASQLERLAFSGDVTPQTRGAIDKVAESSPEAAQQNKPPAALATQNIGAAYGPSNGLRATAGVSPPFVEQLVTLVVGAPEFQRR